MHIRVVCIYIGKCLLENKLQHFYTYLNSLKYNVCKYYPFFGHEITKTDGYEIIIFNVLNHM